MISFHLGVIGLGTMGANLARNAATKGVKVVVFNRTTKKTDDFVEQYASEGDITGVADLQELVSSLKAPRVILIMVNAGDAVDAVINELLPLLSKGDILIDGGNSHFKDTERRCDELSKKGISFLGVGVSGGAEGALKGPSLMPGGDRSAYKKIEPLLNEIAASDGIGGKCVSYMGQGGAGHFVKMVHNGIEYALMQLIAEAFHVLKIVGGFGHDELSEIFDHWNDGDDLESFLIEITSKILAKKEGKLDLLNMIVDTAEQKGTGKWTTVAAHDLGVAIPTVNAAIDARILSGSADLRKARGDFSLRLDFDEPKPKQLVYVARSALHLSMITAYQQGLQLLSVASKKYKWEMSPEECARIWLGGCIIRSSLLREFRLSGSSYFTHQFDSEKQIAWRLLLELSFSRGIPMPSTAASLSYFDAIRTERLPQYLIQAQRDFFGAHGFGRVDRPGTFHGEW